MLFNSYEFLFLFLPLVLAGYFVLFRRAGRLPFLTLASYLFYGWWDFRFCGLMLLSTVIDYAAGLCIERAATPRVRKRWVILSVLANLSLLGFFKYFDLAAQTLNGLASALGAGHPLLPLLKMTLPVGISFYTFQSMSYTIDVYRRVVPAQRSFLKFAFYVSFFPQLVAGPIVRYRDLADQLQERMHSWDLAARGIALFILGLGKKVILADAVAPLAEKAFGMAAPGCVDAWLGALAYTLQIYFDFSGYSDMAVGLGLLFGFHFPQNFNSPYQAVSITDFWRRWHMSLSTWLRDYLYIPLGGNRLGATRTYVNLLFTMLLGGLWHGANGTFVIWGGFHGLLLALERARGGRLWSDATPALVRRGTTFLLVLVGWVFFRCDTAAHALQMLAGMVGLNGSHSELLAAAAEQPLSHVLLALGLVLAWGMPNSWQLKARPGLLPLLLIASLFLLCIAVLLVNASSPFLYFQF